MTAREMEYRRLGRWGRGCRRCALGDDDLRSAERRGRGTPASWTSPLSVGSISSIPPEMYPVPARADTCGETERIVGNWLVRQVREKRVIATKVAGPARSLEWDRGGPLALDRANIRAAVEGSLRRLRTEYIDLYQLHWPARNQPLFGQLALRPGARARMHADPCPARGACRTGGGGQDPPHRPVERSPGG